jgi:hypothetical protein
MCGRQEYELKMAKEISIDRSAGDDRKKWKRCLVVTPIHQPNHHIDEFRLFPFS